MTTILRVCRYRWRWALFGVIATAAFVFWSGTAAPVYFAQSDMVFLGPTSDTNPNALANTATSLISTAGIIQREMDHARTDAKTSSAAVTLVDQGVTDGTRVRVPDYGGQWQNNHTRAVLDVQVTGSSAAEVEDRMLATQQEIARLLDELQDRAGVRESYRIVVRPSPPRPSVETMAGHPSRAAGTAALLGISLTVTGCCLADMLLRPTRNRRRRASVPVTGRSLVTRRLEVAPIEVAR